MRVLLFLSLVLSIACQKEPKKEASKADLSLLQEMQDTYQALPSQLIDSNKFKESIELGRKLYFEERLSVNNQISCNSCHMLGNYGVDNEKTSPGHDGTRGDRNSPTVFNAGLHIAQFWDGRAKDLAAQAIGPILNPIEHGLASEADAMKKIDTPEYREMFKAAGLEFTYLNIGNAIAAFEKTLLTPSRFDDYIKGDVFAINEQEKRGMQKFAEIGCTSCHDGAGFGGNQYQLLGLAVPYKTEDLGRYNVTKNEEDKHVFKVPSLRNVHKTAPYFHDGHIETLDQAIKVMAKHQLDAEIKEGDLEDIKAFLDTLTAKMSPAEMAKI